MEPFIIQMKIGLFLSISIIFDNVNRILVTTGGIQIFAFSFYSENGTTFNSMLGTLLA